MTTALTRRHPAKGNGRRGVGVAPGWVRVAIVAERAHRGRMSSRPPNDDPFDLERFVHAQAANFDDALAELRAGRKRSHWMWYVFPQIAGLGSSSMAQRYAIQSLDEARAYLAHPVLGPRLRQVSEAVVAVPDRNVTALEIMGRPDDMKLFSSMTLFAHVSAPGSVFHRVLEHYFGGEQVAATLARV